MFWASARISWSGSKAPGGRELWQSRRKFDADAIDPEIKARLDDLGVTVFAGSPADFAKHIADETEKWGKVIRAANIKPD